MRSISRRRASAAAAGGAITLPRQVEAELERHHVVVRGGGCTPAPGLKSPRPRHPVSATPRPGPSRIGRMAPARHGAAKSAQGSAVHVWRCAHRQRRARSPTHRRSSGARLAGVARQLVARSAIISASWRAIVSSLAAAPAAMRDGVCRSSWPVGAAHPATLDRDRPPARPARPARVRRAAPPARSRAARPSRSTRHRGPARARRLPRLGNVLHQRDRRRCMVATSRVPLYRSGRWAGSPRRRTGAGRGGRGRSRGLAAGCGQRAAQRRVRCSRGPGPGQRRPFEVRAGRGGQRGQGQGRPAAAMNGSGSTRGSSRCRGGAGRAEGARPADGASTSKGEQREVDRRRSAAGLARQRAAHRHRGGERVDGRATGPRAGHGVGQVGLRRA